MQIAASTSVRRSVINRPGGASSMVGTSGFVDGSGTDQGLLPMAGMSMGMSDAGLGTGMGASSMGTSQVTGTPGNLAKIQGAYGAGGSSMSGMGIKIGGGGTSVWGGPMGGSSALEVVNEAPHEG